MFFLTQDLFHLFYDSSYLFKTKDSRVMVFRIIKIYATELWMFWSLNEMFCSLLHSLSIISFPVAWLRKKWSQRTILKLCLWIMQGSFPDYKPVASCKPRKMFACNKFSISSLFKTFPWFPYSNLLTTSFSDTINF